MIKELLLLLALSSSFAYRIYKPYGDEIHAQFTLSIQISNCRQAEIKGVIVPSIGFVDTTGKLIWKLELPAFEGTGGEEATVEVTHSVDPGVVAHLERQCYFWTDARASNYHQCFRPNIVSFRNEGHWPLSWKPESVTITTSFLEYMRTWIAGSQMRSGRYENCSTNWIDSDKKESYLRLDTKDDSGQKYLPSAVFKIGKYYP
ncbi:hypothetical protein QR680_014116 [Steinernema hermaphroditum]|uniref:Reelin domain-containing protein n=1 Tax=Steinernema hermaphroditum TaxID=289476 RepID=A0AA39I9U3_9BILA|nr:hypothetical protein QR680_014116 [Steinernema hermaphroditum]